MNLTIGKIIKELRTKRGLSQEKLAEYLGIAPQSVSKWERAEGYPDITILIPLAEFFGVSLDVLMGRDTEQKELKIQRILARLEHNRHAGDHAANKQLATEAYGEFPLDFRIVRWYILSLLDIEDIHVNKTEIEKLCRYILGECTEDSIRYDTIGFLMELYSRCGEYERAMSYTQMLPDMQMCQEFAACMMYPENDERDFHASATFIEGAMERVIWLACRIAHYRPSLTRAERIQILEQTCAVVRAVYPDFDCGICHSAASDVYVLLFKFYSEENQTERALAALREAFRHAKAVDDIENEVICHTSPLLKGHTFDMNNTWSGSTGTSVGWVITRLTDSYEFPVYQDHSEYRALLDEYRPFTRCP